jgi:catechol 2,3-dioxygenase-like lactoylglutathione lyase family enzyme
MIKGLYETHLFVENLERSIAFYETILGLKQCYFEEDRRAAFFWIGQPKEAMLGLWEKPKAEIDKRHFAFRCDKEYILNKSVGFLKGHNLKPYNFLQDGTERPMVFAWMPAIAIYFDDPDGHSLEFIAILEGNSRPELGVVSYKEWLEHQPYIVD